MRKFLRRERLRRAHRLIRRAERAAGEAVHPAYRTFVPEGYTVHLEVRVHIPEPGPGPGLTFEELQEVDPDEIAETAREQFLSLRRGFVKGSYDNPTR